MTSKKKQEELREEKQWESIDQAVVKSENFLFTYRKQILIAIAAMVVVTCIYLAYKKFYVEPLNHEAQVALYKGEDYFKAGLDSVALHGDGKGYIGFEAIATEYSSTEAGNLAKAYAGISYANLGKYDKSLTYLQDYSGSGELFGHIVNGTIGDCLDNQGKLDEAIEYYLKAAKGADSQTYSPIFYKKAGLIYRQKKNSDKVIEIFSIIKNNYMNSPTAAEADKYIAEATAAKASK